MSISAILEGGISSLRDIARSQYAKNYAEDFEPIAGKYVKSVIIPLSLLLLAYFLISGK